MTEQEPLTFRQTAAAATVLGYAYSLAVVAWNYFIRNNTFYDSARYGIVTGVGVAGYTSTVLFFPPRQRVYR